MKRNKILHALLLAFMTSLMIGCGINSNVMFKTPKGGDFQYDSIPLRPVEDYRLSPDDKITFTLSPNNGEKLVESISGTGDQLRQDLRNSMITDYIIKSNGFVNLPIIGDVQLAGLTVKQSEDTLKKLYANQYQSPFIQLRVTNQRCIIFTGLGSDAQIVPIQNNNTTLMEVIALAGGIPARGQAKSIKLMRRVNGKREVYLIDLSTIEGLKYSDMIIQGNDYIYIEPNPELARGMVKELSPIVGLISSTFIILSVLNIIK
jgi:polysaccharide biosynthesis/export protein